MPIVTFSDRDILMGTLVEVAWYRVKIDSVGEEPTTTAKGPSTNYPVEGTILFNGDTGDVKFKGVPLRWNFNSKAMGFAKGFLESFGVSPEANRPFDLAAAEGQTLDVYIEHGEYQGRTGNRVNHKYRAPRADVSATAQLITCCCLIKN